MARLNTPAAPRPRGPIITEKVASARNANGGAAYARDAKSELFLAAATSLNENTLYESAATRAARLRPLIAEIAIADPDWVASFVSWLRTSANLRSIAVLVAADAVHARLAAAEHGSNREIVRASIHRADEPGEFLAYWVSQFGRNIPKPVKRGVADAVLDLYTEKAWLKWRGRGDAGSMSMADVLNLVHPAAKTPRQAQLFEQIIAHAYGKTTELGEDLRVLRARDEFSKLTPDAMRVQVRESAAELSAAGLTHEALAGYLGKLDAEAWAALVPTMGYQALRMNLRRIVEAGVDAATVQTIVARLSDPDEVANSRQMPLQFLAAFQSAPMQFHWPLEVAMNQSLARVPRLSGRTLILVDRSGSMFSPLSAKGSMLRSDAAAVFGSALALRAENATLVQYGTSSAEVPFRKSDSVLQMATKQFAGLGGTATRAAVQKHFAGHDRVINLTDEVSYNRYAADPYEGLVPEKTHVFTWNLAGYRHGDTATGKYRHTFGGLTDIGFDLIEPIEAGFIAGWPWEQG